MAFRIARVSERILPLRGGKEVHVSELTRQQLKLGHDVSVLFRCGDGESVSPAGSHRIVLPSAARRLDGLAGTALFGAVAARVVAASPKSVTVRVQGDFSGMRPVPSTDETCSGVTDETCSGVTDETCSRGSLGFRKA